MRILFVAMVNSVHAARWISQISDCGWDVHLFPAFPAIIHPLFTTVIRHGPIFPRSTFARDGAASRTVWLLERSAALLRISARVVPNLSAQWLAWTIRRVQPHIVHSMEIQHAGYLTLDARKRLKDKFPLWLVSNWGSDIYLFGRLAEHREQIRSVLAACNYYHAECHRDVELAQRLGLQGEVLPVLPVGGGFDLEHMRQFRQPGPTSARQLIALKGYQHWSGRALVGLHAIELCADLLRGYQVVVYSPSPDVTIAAELMSASTGIPVEIERSRWSREDILRVHGRARLSIGLSISDAISTSLLETMIMGSFPIQSNTGCGNEWLRNGQTALFVHPEDPEAVAAAIRRAVTDDALVDRAAELNARTACERLDQAVIRPQVVAMYERIFAESRGQGHKSGM